MKITLTGSLGHISKPLAIQLIAQGHEVSIISSKPEKKNDIGALGAKAAIGSIDDAAFLSTAFEGADIVYLMEPPFDFFDNKIDTHSYWKGIAQCYKKAILASGATKIIHLSSIGAHTDKGNGMLSAHYEVENILKELPENVAIKFMRPVGFYYNIFAFIQSIKNQGLIIQNYGGGQKEPWVSPLDIASVIAEEMEKPFTGRPFRYIASDEVSPNEVAEILGQAIGKPDVKWVTISDEEFENALVSMGFSPNSAKGFTEMNAGRRNHLYDHYNENKPTLGKIKLTDFAKEFAAVYIASNHKQ